VGLFFFRITQHRLFKPASKANEKNEPKKKGARTEKGNRLKIVVNIGQTSGRGKNH